MIRLGSRRYLRKPTEILDRAKPINFTPFLLQNSALAGRPKTQHLMVVTNTIEAPHAAAVSSKQQIKERFPLLEGTAQNLEEILEAARLATVFAEKLWKIGRNIEPDLRVNQRLILHPDSEPRDQFLSDARANIDLAISPGFALEARQCFGEITRGIKMNLQSFVRIETPQHQT